MAIGLTGRKLGMTRVFNDDGTSVPVTVVHLPDNRVTRVRTRENDGYHALQLVSGEGGVARVTKPMAGHFRKAGVEAGRTLREFRSTQAGVSRAGDAIGVGIFSEGQKVSVIGTSQGKGFAGAIKRHNFCSQDASHGNSLSHRALGATGQCQTPGRVFKGKKMAGQMGDVRVTVKNLEIVKVDKDRKLLLIKGAIPGCRDSVVTVRHPGSVEWADVITTNETNVDEATAGEAGGAAPAEANDGT